LLVSVIVAFVVVVVFCFRCFAFVPIFLIPSFYLTALQCSLLLLK